MTSNPSPAPTPDLATPRPWFWDSYSRIYGGPPVVVGDADPEYRQVVPLPRPTRGDVTTAQGAADAALIVEAVNNYDRLRAALQTIYDLPGDYPLDKAKEIARAAIQGGTE